MDRISNDDIADAKAAWEDAEGHGFYGPVYDLYFGLVSRQSQQIADEFRRTHPRRRAANPARPAD